MHKEYQTPSGKLTSIVRKTEYWHYGNSVPLFDDYLVPRSEKFLFERKEDLEPLRCLFAEPSAEDISSFHQKAKDLKRFATDKGLLVSGGWVYSTPEKLNRDAGTMGADALINVALWG